jgi:glycosyltransferase involved in cell wall biosynthesis
MKIKYSIVIPTRNKAEYLPFAIKSVLKSTRTDIELIVSDNFSTDNTAKILRDFSDPRLRVIQPDVALPMAGHYEFAISKATGEWITILGDDDAVMPYIFESLDKYILKYSDVDIISSARAYYFWEGCENIYGDLVVAYSSKFKDKIRSTKNDLYKALLGLHNFLDMPQLYTTGIIKKSLYEEIKLKCSGYFYYSIIPDIYSAVAICLARNSYLRIEEPLFWTGTSNKSMGISNQIYLDAKHLTEKLKNNSIKIPKNISADISYYLHLNQFGCMYFYECLLQCPLTSKSFRASHWLRTLVLARVYNESKKKKKEVRSKLLKVISFECKKYKIQDLRFKLISFILLIISSVYFFFSLPKKIFKRLGVFGYIKFYSRQRKLFLNIFDASIKISELRKKKL